MCEAKSLEWIMPSAAPHTPVKQLSLLSPFYRWHSALEKVVSNPSSLSDLHPHDIQLCVPFSLTFPGLCE